MMSGDGDYGVVREDVMATAQEQVHALALQGLSAGEIERALDCELTATEWELLRGWVRREAERSRFGMQAPRSDTGERAKGMLRRVSGRSWLMAALVAVPALAVGILLGAALTSGGGHERRVTSQPPSQAKRSTPPPRKSRPARRPQAGTRPLAPARPPIRRVDVAGAAAFNARGFWLMNHGRYRDAIPVLRRAVAASVPSSADLTKAYALYNLGRSLRLAGRPREAIRLLERRLKINNQRETVARELKAARRSLRSSH